MKILGLDSCVLPASYVQVDEVARICAALGVGHIVNNAYGVQCSKTCRLVNRYFSKSNRVRTPNP